jgi:RNA polymerase sigma factor (sigma-70 family)
MSASLETMLAAVERHRRRVWGLCYRMTGRSDAADDLAQEALARAIERASQVQSDEVEGWLYRVTTTICLDWLRRQRVERRTVTLVDPLDLPEPPVPPDAEERLLRREDFRYAIVATLQLLPPAQRAVLVLRDVLDRSTEETASALGQSTGAIKVALHRARARLEEAHRVGRVDVPADAAVVAELASAIERGDMGGVIALLDEDVWGVVDGGVLVRTARKPTLGRRAVGRQWTNALRRFGVPSAVELRVLNGEAAVVVYAGAPLPLASIHVETRAGRLISLRALLDPSRLARLAPAA